MHSPIFYCGTWGVEAGPDNITQTQMCEMIQAVMTAAEKRGIIVSLSTLHGRCFHGGIEQGCGGWVGRCGRQLWNEIKLNEYNL